jgi:ABC-2 type transport system permease protein
VKVSAASAVAAKEFREAWRNRVFLIIAVLFLVFSALSVYIGSSTKHAELAAYAQTVALLKASGTTSFPAPPEIFPLAILRNHVTYVSMIGALLAIFLGFDLFTKERDGGNLRLLLSRPVLRDQILGGKLLSGAAIIGLLQGLALVAGVVLLQTVGGLAPTAAGLARLATFAALSFAYLMLFYLVALLASLWARTDEVAFLACIVFWIAASFVVPQLAQTQKAYAYAANASAGTITQLPQDTAVSLAIESVSPTAHFERVGNRLLQVEAETARIPLGAVLAGAGGDLAYLGTALTTLLFLIYWRFVSLEVSEHA